MPRNQHSGSHPLVTAPAYYQSSSKEKFKFSSKVSDDVGTNNLVPNYVNVFWILPTSQNVGMRGFCKAIQSILHNKRGWQLKSGFFQWKQ